MPDESSRTEDAGEGIPKVDRRRIFWSVGLPLLIIGSWHTSSDIARQLANPRRHDWDWITGEVLVTLAGLALAAVGRPARTMGRVEPLAAALIGAAIAAVGGVLTAGLFGYR